MLFLRTIILLGALQGFIVSGLLFFSFRPQRANRLLGALIFFISLASLKLYSEWIQGFYDWQVTRILDAFFPFIVIMPVGPLLYFYVRAFSDPQFVVTRKMRVHFYPVLIDLVPQLTAVVYVVGVMAGRLRVNNGPWGAFIDTYNVYADIPRWISMTTYVWLAGRYLSRRKRMVKSDEHVSVDFRWLRQVIQVLLVFQGIWLAYLIPYVIPRYTDALLNSVDWYPVYIPLAIIIYWLGIKGVLMAYRQGMAAKQKVRQPVVVSDALVDEVVRLLLKAMKSDKLYLNPELSVGLLSEHTGIAPKTISAVLNQHLNKSFSEFVNEYRVEAIKERLLKPESSHLTIVGLAYECGFNSQPTFQRAFKATMGLSPREFLLKNRIS